MQRLCQINRPSELSINRIQKKFNRSSSHSHSKSSQKSISLKNYQNFWIKRKSINADDQILNVNDKKNIQKQIRKKIILGSSNVNLNYKQTKTIADQTNRESVFIFKTVQINKKASKCKQKNCLDLINYLQSQNMRLMQQNHKHKIHLEEMNNKTLILQQQISKLNIKLMQNSIQKIPHKQFIPLINFRISEDIKRFQLFQLSTEMTLNSHRSLDNTIEQFQFQDEFNNMNLLNQISVLKSILKSLQISVDCEKRKHFIEIQQHKKDKQKQIIDLKYRHTQLINKCKSDMKKNISQWMNSHQTKKMQMNQQIEFVLSDQEDIIQ